MNKPRWKYGLVRWSIIIVAVVVILVLVYVIVIAPQIAPPVLQRCNCSSGP